MKLARKLTIALVVGVTIVLLLHGWFGARRERAFLEADTRRDAHVMGRTLVAVINEVRRGKGDAPARALIDDANEREASVNFRWVWLDGAQNEAPPLAPLDQLGGLFEGREVVTRLIQGEDERLLTYVPLRREAGKRAAAIEVAESLAEQRSYVRTSLLATGLTTVTMIMVAALITSLLGAWMVGRPVHALVEKARRVGRGDLAGPIVLRQSDELGELALEMNAMCDRLEAERSARQQTLEELRHAHRLVVVGRLASGIAHELGTPIHVIAGWARMIATREVEGDAAVEAATHIGTAAERMTKIIRQLLDFARRRAPRKDPLDLRQLVRQTMALLAPLAEKRRVSPEVLCPEQEVLVDADAAQLQQALANLVVNGIDAMRSGGRLTVRVEEVTRATPSGGDVASGRWARLAVRDRGIGIGREHLDKIFEPFFTTKEVGEGTGLGLSVSFGIVEEHGGFIEVESTSSEGTSIALFLRMSVRGGESCPVES